MRGLQEPLRGLLEGPLQLEYFLSLCCSTSTGCVFHGTPHSSCTTGTARKSAHRQVDKHSDSEIQQFQQSDAARPSWGWRGHLRRLEDSDARCANAAARTLIKQTQTLFIHIIFVFVNHIYIYIYMEGMSSTLTRTNVSAVAKQRFLLGYPTTRSQHG